MKNAKLISTLLLLLNIQAPAYAVWKIPKPKIIEDITREATNCFKGGCDPDRMIKVAMKSHISNATEGLTDEVQESVIEASDHIFDNQIDPLVERTAVLASKIIREGGELAEIKANNIIENAVEDIVEGFDPWVENAISLANSLAKEFTPRQIQERLINTSFDRLNALEERLFADADKLISKTLRQTFEGLNELADKTDCKVAGHRLAIENFVLKKLIEDLNPFNDIFNKDNRACRKEIDVSLTKKFRSFETGQLYDYRKCILKRDLSMEQNSDILLSRYADLTEIASEFTCIARSSTSKERFIKDWFYYTDKYNVLEELVYD